MKNYFIGVDINAPIVFAQYCGQLFVAHMNKYVYHMLMSHRIIVRRVDQAPGVQKHGRNKINGH